MRVVFLPGAEQDMKAIRQYVVQRFGAEVWRDTLGALRKATHGLQRFAMRGGVPDELADLGTARYRQLVSGMNRVIYEVAGDVVYIHIVCDTRRDLRSLLARRLLRVAE